MDIEAKTNIIIIPSNPRNGSEPVNDYTRMPCYQIQSRWTDFPYHSLLYGRRTSVHKYVLL